jgi:hypothetical protein
LAFVGYHMAKEAVAGRNPLTMLNRARAAVSASKGTRNSLTANYCYVLVANEYQEALHPRDDHGRFASGSLAEAAAAGGKTGAAAAIAKGKLREAIGSARGTMSKDASEIYDRLTPAEKLQVDVRHAAGRALQSVVDRAKSIAGAVWNRMSTGQRTACTRVANTVMAVEHHLNSIGKSTRAMVDEISKQRGLTPEQSRAVRTTVGAADMFTTNVTNIPFVHEQLERHGVGEHLGTVGTFMAAKVGFYMPIGSAAYIAYAAVRHPLATARAAKAMVAKAHFSLSHGLSFGEHAHGDATAGSIASAAAAAGSAAATAAAVHAGLRAENRRITVNREDVEAIVEAYAAHGWDTWYQALLHGALDRTRGDVAQSIVLANEAYKDQPTDPSAPAPGDAEELMRKEY